MQHDHSTGLSGSRRNVYRIGPSTAVLKSRKPRNHFRLFLEEFCALPPAERLEVIKIWLAKYGTNGSVRPLAPRPNDPHHPPATFFLSNGISPELWERFGKAQDEAWRTEWPEWARREWAERFGKEPTL